MLKYNKRHYPAIAPIDVNLDYTLIEDFLWENYDRWQNNFEAHKGLAVASNNVASDTYKAVQHFHLTECRKEEQLEEAKEYLNTMPHWQYIKFDYNKDNVEVARRIAMQNNLGFIEIDSNR